MVRGEAVARWGRWAVSVALLLTCALGPARVGVADRLRDVAGPAAFRVLDWESQALGERGPRVLGGLTAAPVVRATDREVVARYFAARTEPERLALRGAVEEGIERAVAAVLAEANVAARPMGLRLGAGPFPPVLVALTPPPNVLVASPRTELRVLQSVLVNPLPVPAQEALERSADSGDVSSLVAPIGGLATYPAMVLESRSAAEMVTSAAHEWTHHYLAFAPLGAAYWRDQRTREINETTADMVGAEVGVLALERLGLPRPPGPGTAPAPTNPDSAFDFRAFMRETRLTLESLLAQRRVDEAESYLVQRRDEVNTHGYAIRKLNQAYFALYGSYAEGFAGSARSEVPGLLRRVRQRSGTLAAFLRDVSAVTDLGSLRQVAGGG